MKTAVFRIEGMNCDGCATTIKCLLVSQPGVEIASVSFSTAEARVRYDPRSIGEERLIEVIQQPGFRVMARPRASDAIG